MRVEITAAKDDEYFYEYRGRKYLKRPKFNEKNNYISKYKILTYVKCFGESQYEISVVSSNGYWVAAKNNVYDIERRLFGKTVSTRIISLSRNKKECFETYLIVENDYEKITERNEEDLKNIMKINAKKDKIKSIEKLNIMLYKDNITNICKKYGFNINSDGIALGGEDWVKKVIADIVKTAFEEIEKEMNLTLTNKLSYNRILTSPYQQIAHWKDIKIKK